jgi:hypothetical protein
MSSNVGGIPPSPGGQLVTGLVTIVTLFLVLFVVEAVYLATQDAANRFRTLIDYTASSEDISLVIYQNPSRQNAIPIGLSVNERSGIEFAYSFHMLVFPTTFSGQAVLKHVFHKGYNRPWPLMGPGVFIRGDSNAMRVFMNTYANPYTYVDIRNIPVQKWFHVVLNCYKGGLDIFVNGNLANRIPFENTLPYQNFQDIILFSNARYTLRGSQIPAISKGGVEETLEMDGAFKGYLSNLKYARYALSVSEIQKLLAEGPSSKLKQKVLQKPPYLADDWWANQV